MKIVVCVKQVPDTKGGVKFKPDGTLDRAAMLTIMNPDDKAGLEAALRIKDETGAEVTVVTMGLPKAEEVQCCKGMYMWLGRTWFQYCNYACKSRNRQASYY